MTGRLLAKSLIVLVSLLLRMVSLELILFSIRQRYSRATRAVHKLALNL
jgi:hypothetical protein